MVTVLPSVVLFFFIVACKTSTTPPDIFKAKVLRVKDGDTVEVLYHQTPITVRLAHIDCPERKQPYYQRAKQFSTSFCVGKKVKVITQGKYDRYRRLLGEVVYQRKNLNKELVAHGLALHYKRYSKDTVYANLENHAHRNQLGMWSQQELIAPWLFRKRKKKL